MTDPSNKALPSVPSLPAWTCPTCGRSFHRIKQPHVCDTTTVEDHLRDKDPAVVALFHAFAQAVQDAGPSAFSPIKAQVGFRGHKRIFAGVRLTKRGLEGYLDLPRSVESSRFRRVTPYTRRLFVHHFVLTSLDQLDAEFIGWIQEAYQVGQGLTMPEQMGVSASRPENGTRRFGALTLSRMSSLFEEHGVSHGPRT